MASGWARWGKVLGVVVAVGGAVAAGIYAYAHHAVMDAIARREGQARDALARHRQAILDDQAKLAELELLARRPFARDAGALIAPRLRWIGAGRPEGGERALDPKAGERLGEDWVHAAPGAWAGVDLAWLSELAAYDHWDVDAGEGPVDPAIPRGREPSAVELFTWAELRIAKGVHDGAPGPALREVLDLARLCFTAERGWGQRAGVALLSLVRKAEEKLQLAPLPGTDQETVARIGRAAWGAVAMARLVTPAEYEADFARLPVGRCAALHEGLADALVLRGRLRAARPEAYAHMDRLLAAAPDCRLARLRARWAAPDDPRVLAPASVTDRILLALPGGRHALGELLLGIVEQEWLNLYERPATPAR